MGTKYSSGHADVIEEKTVREFCPAEFEAFMKIVEDDDNLSLDDVAQITRFTPHDDELPKKILEVYEKLQEAFERNTGLTLDLCHHDSENEYSDGDVDGAFWAVDGVYQITPAGKKMMEFIMRARFVNFG